MNLTEYVTDEPAVRESVDPVTGKRKYWVDPRNHAKLVGREVVPCDDLYEWGRSFENKGSRIVKQEFVGKVWVSTVFLGLNHSWIPGPPDLWFETMAFGGPMHQIEFRCETYDQAEEQHQRVCAGVYHLGPRGNPDDFKLYRHSPRFKMGTKRLRKKFAKRPWFYRRVSHD